MRPSRAGADPPRSSARDCVPSIRDSPSPDAKPQFVFSFASGIRRVTAGSTERWTRPGVIEYRSRHAARDSGFGADASRVRGFGAGSFAHGVRAQAGAAGSRRSRRGRGRGDSERSAECRHVACSRAGRRRSTEPARTSLYPAHSRDARPGPPDVDHELRHARASSGLSATATAE